IIPKFEEIFTDMGVELPALTLGLINTSRWMAGDTPGQAMPGAIVIVFAPFVLWFLFKLVRKTPFGRAVIDWVFLKIPVFGSLIKKSTTARFTRTLGTLINAGVPILDAIKITAETSGNWVFERALNKVHDSIREGESFAQPLRETKACDAMVVNMIDVGEETGDMDSMLMKIADTYEYEVDVAVEALVKLIEPMMVVVLGGMVGTIVIAMFLPMINMIEALSG
ncbi:MAG: type II secretion system F family protein, partial [Planctomycetota bacterium]